MSQKYFPTIGLEVHVQLKTRSKMFCGCPVAFGAEPNSHTCPVCLGYPGALPVMNEEALKMSALTGLMLGCEIPEICKFDRKNYFYPDMPKNYQITQYDQPICAGGAVPLHDLAYPKDAQKSIKNPGKSVRLTRIHLEEDVAKSFHFDTSTGIDFNRAGTPLMEIVSEPEIDSPEEAFAYLTSLQQILIYGDVSDADMEKGQLRCDCNVSVRPDGQQEFGTKIEIKNMNSISGVRRALAYEIERQMVAVSRGETLVQSTRRWDDNAAQTLQMRTKESAHDYRYFPDPDLLPVKTKVFTQQLLAQHGKLLLGKKREEFIAEMAAAGIVRQALAEHYENLLGAAMRMQKNWSLVEEHEALVTYYKTVSHRSKTAANWIINDLLPALAVAELSIADCPISADALSDLVKLVDTGVISGKQGKEVFAEMFATGNRAARIVAEKGLAQENDAGAIETLCAQVIAANPKVVAEFRAGKTQSINFLKGQVMKLSQGKANPNVASEILVRQLSNQP